MGLRVSVGSCFVEVSVLCGEDMVGVRCLHVAAVETMATMMAFCLLSKMVYGPGSGL